MDNALPCPPQVQKKTEEFLKQNLRSTQCTGSTIGTALCKNGQHQCQKVSGVTVAVILSTDSKSLESQCMAFRAVRAQSQGQLSQPGPPQRCSKADEDADVGNML